MTDPNLRRLLDISRMGSDHESRHFAFLKRESLFKPEEIEKNKLHFNTIESQLCVSIRRNAYCSGERSSLLLQKIEIL